MSEMKTSDITSKIMSSVVSKINIETVDGIVRGTATVQFDLNGALCKDVRIAGKLKAGDVESLLKLSEQQIYKKAQADDFEGYRFLLEDYIWLRINEIIGMNKVPLVVNDEGKLEGIREDVEVEFN